MTASRTQQPSSSSNGVLVANFLSGILVLPSMSNLKDQVTPTISEAADMLEEEIGPRDYILGNGISSDKCLIHAIRNAYYIQ